MEVSDYEYRRLVSMIESTSAGVDAMQARLIDLDAMLTKTQAMLQAHDRDMDKLQAVVWVLTKLVAAQSEVKPEELTEAIKKAAEEISRRG
jgi:hypothetical protein